MFRDVLYVPRCSAMFRDVSVDASKGPEGPKRPKRPKGEKIISN